MKKYLIGLLLFFATALFSFAAPSVPEASPDEQTVYTDAEGPVFVAVHLFDVPAVESQDFPAPVIGFTTPSFMGTDAGITDVHQESGESPSDNEMASPGTKQLKQHLTQLDYQRYRHFRKPLYSPPLLE